MALLMLLLTRIDALRAFAALTSIATATGAAAALRLFVYRTGERTTFTMTHGRAGVLKLAAGIGCLRRSRAFVPVLAQAIRDARRIQAATSRAALLRAEMREHYRLLEAGMLSREHCSAATGRILAKFD